MNKYDLIVVGGGIAGLYTIYKFLKKTKLKDPKILLLEASNRLGGRVKTIKRDGFSFESGAGRFSKHHKLLFELLKDLDLEKLKVKISSDYRYLPESHYKDKTSLKEIIKTIKSSLIFKKLEKEKQLESKTLNQIAKSISTDLAKQLDKYYSYYSEANVMNSKEALKSLERDFTGSTQYYVLQGGLEQIIDKMVKKIEKKVEIRKNEKLNDFCLSGTGFELITNQEKKYYCGGLVLAIPQKALLKLKFISNSPLKKSLSLVSPQPLYRLYAKFEKNWLKEKVITDLPLKFIIPMNDQGLMMITYTDGLDTKKWINLSVDPVKLEKEIRNELKKVFGSENEKKIPKIEWFDYNSYWNHGAHYWLPRPGGINQNKLEEAIRHPSNLNLWIVGESFSNYQAWIEGSLETSQKTVDDLIKISGTKHNKLFNFLDATDQKVVGRPIYGIGKFIGDHILSGGGQAKSNRKITLNELKKHNKKTDAWMALYGNVYDITKWISDHPGGDIILKGAGKDATKLFERFSHSPNAKNMLNNKKDPRIVLIGKLK